jgi:hypothetical protein
LVQDSSVAIENGDRCIEGVCNFDRESRRHCASNIESAHHTISLVRPFDN